MSSDWKLCRTMSVCVSLALVFAGCDRARKRETEASAETKADTNKSNGKARRIARSLVHRAKRPARR